MRCCSFDRILEVEKVRVVRDNDRMAVVGDKPRPSAIPLESPRSMLCLCSR